MNQNIIINKKTYTIEQIDKIFTKAYGNADWHLFIATLFSNLVKQGRSHEQASAFVNRLVHDVSFSVFEQECFGDSEI